MTLRAHLVSTSRNIVLGETVDTRTYETRFGLRVRVKTICEMQIALCPLCGCKEDSSKAFSGHKKFCPSAIPF